MEIPPNLIQHDHDEVQPVEVLPITEETMVKQNSSYGSESFTYDESESAGTRKRPLPLRWYRNYYIIIPLLLFFLLLLSISIVCAIYYPQDPIIRPFNSRVSNVQFGVTSPPFHLNATVSVEVEIKNENYYDSYYEETVIPYFYERNVAMGGNGGGASSGGRRSYLGSFDIPAGCLSSRSSVLLNLTSEIVNFVLSDFSALIELSSGVNAIRSYSSTAGYVNFIFGNRIDYQVNTACTVQFQLDVLTLNVNIVKQMCNTQVEF